MVGGGGVVCGGGVEVSYTFSSCQRSISGPPLADQQRRNSPPPTEIGAQGRAPPLPGGGRNEEKKKNKDKEPFGDGHNIYKFWDKGGGCAAISGCMN